jgi:hypothetical protein
VGGGRAGAGGEDSGCEEDNMLRSPAAGRPVVAEVLRGHVLAAWRRAAVRCKPCAEMVSGCGGRVLCAAKDETFVEFMRPLLNSWAECSVVISC